jgi:folylpolyglutamate synthase/dihydropteroate synthase
MSYAEAVDHLYARGLELAPNTPAPRRKFDLEHMRILARALGSPQDRFPSVLIAGTNGKGSTSATLASILTAAGYRTALYTSPHLSRVNERIQIDGTPISDDDFARLYFQVDSTAERLVAEGALPHPPSFFETLTALAFLYFAGEAEGSGTRDHGLGTSQQGLGTRAPELETKQQGPDPMAQRVGARDQEIRSHQLEQQSLEGLSHAATTSTGVDSLSHPPNTVIPTEAQRSGGIRFSTQAPNPAYTQLKTAQRTAVDIAILEVGLGGRLDATNIVDPLLSILTDISLDHQDYLGTTIAEITREKAGVLRPQGTLVTLPQHPEANQAIGEAAQELDLHAISATPYLPTAEKLLTQSHTRVGAVAQSVTPSRPYEGLSALLSQSSPHSKDVVPNQSSPSLKGVILSEAQRAESKDLRLPQDAQGSPQQNAPLQNTFRNRYTIPLAGEPLHVDSPLWGEHQQRNLALAIAAAEELRNRTGYKNKPSNTHSYKITNHQIEAGIRNTFWPGRLELLPLSNSAPILLDVAHNPAGAWTLRAALSHLPEAQPRTLLFSCLRDKDLREMSQILLPLFDSTSPDRPGDHILFAPINSPRAASLDQLEAAAASLEIPAESLPSLEQALTRARTITPADGIIVATGSVYLIGELRSLILPQAAQ